MESWTNSLIFIFYFNYLICVIEIIEKRQLQHGAGKVRSVKNVAVKSIEEMCC